MLHVLNARCNARLERHAPPLYKHGSCAAPSSLHHRIHHSRALSRHGHGECGAPPRSTMLQLLSKQNTRSSTHAAAGTQAAGGSAGTSSTSSTSSAAAPKWTLAATRPAMSDAPLVPDVLKTNHPLAQFPNKRLRTWRRADGRVLCLRASLRLLSARVRHRSAASLREGVNCRVSGKRYKYKRGSERADSSRGRSEERVLVADELAGISVERAALRVSDR